MPIIPIPGWQSYYGLDGAVLALHWLTPERSVCADDRRAYAQLVGVAGISGAGASLTGGALVTAAGLKPRLSGGHRRITDRVWESWVVLNRPGVLGQVLPATLQPCAGVSAQYRLQAVNVVRDSGNAFQRGLAELENLGEMPTKDFIAGAGEVAGEALGDTAGVVAETALRFLLPLAVPLAIGYAAYLAFTKAAR